MASLDITEIHILVAEENRFMLNTMRQILTGLGVTKITTATNSDEAIEELKTNTPDLLLTSWKLEPLSGILLAKYVRTNNDSNCPYLPIILASAYSDRENVYIARDAGINEFLVKPFSPQALFSRIKAVIEQPRQFIKTQDYFGPDRRRRNDPNYEGPERRKKKSGLSGDKIKELLNQEDVNELFTPEET
jgi:DNA-binding response OmpR family regulator